MKLWGRRFTKETDQLVHNSSEPLSFDQKFYYQDMGGSITHVKTLEKQGILSTEDRDDVTRGLGNIPSDLGSEALTISSNSGYEGIHSFVGGILTERIGEAGKRLHTGRSRNDQVALDVKLYTRDETDEIEKLVGELSMELLVIMETNTDTFMPDFTHLQKAQPITLAHHMGTYFEMSSRDRSRLQDIHKRMNYCPLGSGALTGTTYPSDRKYMVVLLGFDGPTLNSMDSVADRDCLIKLLSTLSTIAVHLGWFCEEIVIWNTNEYRFVEIDNSYSTGSSTMPQKRNPDITELIRDKNDRVYGALASLLATMRGIPLAYNRDVQEDKELTFDAIDTAKGCLMLFVGMIFSISFRKSMVEASAKNGFTNTMDAADCLVSKGVPFRDAHGIAGQLVLLCIERGIALDDLSPEEYRQISPVFEEDVCETTSMEACVKRRVTIGTPGQEVMRQVIEIYGQQLVG